MGKIMLVDDASFMRLMLRTLLLELGHQIVAEAGNGEQAVKMYPRACPDLVIMDITMPDMDGVEAVKNIMALDPEATIIMCSAVGHRNMVLEAMNAGAKDFIVKPFQKERVEFAVSKLLPL